MKQIIASISERIVGFFAKSAEQQLRLLILVLVAVFLILVIIFLYQQITYNPGVYG